MMSSGTAANSLTDHMFGEEVEVSSLLVLDQHTFEGTSIVSCVYSNQQFSVVKAS